MADSTGGELQFQYVGAHGCGLHLLAWIALSAFAIFLVSKKIAVDSGWVISWAERFAEPVGYDSAKTYFLRLLGNTWVLVMM